jgi:hypothetical protein
MMMLNICLVAVPTRESGFAFPGLDVGTALFSIQAPDSVQTTVWEILSEYGFGFGSEAVMTVIAIVVAAAAIYVITRD